MVFAFPTDYNNVNEYIIPDELRKDVDQLFIFNSLLWYTLMYLYVQEISVYKESYAEKEYRSDWTKTHTAVAPRYLPDQIIQKIFYFRTVWAWLPTDKRLQSAVGKIVLHHLYNTNFLPKNLQIALKINYV